MKPDTLDVVLYGFMAEIKRDFKMPLNAVEFIEQSEAKAKLEAWRDAEVHRAWQEGFDAHKKAYQEGRKAGGSNG